MSPHVRTRSAGVALLMFLASACTTRDADSPAPRRLALGLAPPAGMVAERTWHEVGDAFALVPAEDPAGFWVRAAVPAARWSRVPTLPNVWTAARPFLGNGATAGGVSHRLVGASKEYELATWRGHPGGEVPAGYFSAAGAALYATTDDPSGPGDATFFDFVHLGRSESASGRISIEGHDGDGFLLAPGFARTFALELDGPSVLMFKSCTLGRGEPLNLEILLGELVVHTEVLRPAPRSREASHRIELPPLRARQPLTLRVSGAPAVSAILAPVVVPAQALSAARGPDIVLFIADTLRADSLEAYGGPVYLSPHANRLAREGVVFTSAIAPSPWTLPSHASLFTGLYPPEVAVQAPRDALSSEVVTLAEALLAAGYRTAAVTDDAFVSPEYGLAQGFETFDARRRPPEETLEAVQDVLTRDDGRPLFLVVHTYRAHHPYVVSPETRASIGERIGLRADLDESEYASVPESLADWSPERTLTPDERRRMSDYEALYRGASADLDRLLGDCLAVLRAKDRADIVLFTSDHGEAFWEHGVAEHGNGVWDEHLRVPLILVAPGLTPGERESPVSLIDIPRTLAGLVGITPDPRWGGIDIVAGEALRPVLAFQCDLHGNPSSIALYADGKKLIFPDEAEGESIVPSAAYDLTVDAGERHDLRDQPWARELVQTHAQAIHSARFPKVSATTAAPGQSALEELGHLGYGNR